jgi:hypothetical protein
MSHDHHEHAPKWKHDGVRVIPGHTLDPNTAQTPGMDRKAAINFARVGAQKIWAGTVSIQPNAKTGAHHAADEGAQARFRFARKSSGKNHDGSKGARFTVDSRIGAFVVAPDLRSSERDK